MAMHNGAATLENSSALSNKVKHTFTIQPRYPAHRYSHKIKKCSLSPSHMHTHMHVHMLTHHHHHHKCLKQFFKLLQKQETNYMSFNWGMGLLWCIHTMEYRSAIKKNNELLIHTTWWKTVKCIKLWKQSDSRSCIIHNCIAVTF